MPWVWNVALKRGGKKKKKDYLAAKEQKQHVLSHRFYACARLS